MTSYMKLFEDFLQRKESDGTRDVSAMPEEDETQSSCADTPTAGGGSGVGLNNSSSSNKMEHSYTRDSVRSAGGPSASGLAQMRTILVRRPPQCPSCHTHPLEEHDLDDSNQASVPGYNEIAAKEAMNECARIAKYVKNNNADDEDWEVRINQTGWSNMQKTLFQKVVRILDNDHLGRLANVGRQNEPMQRRVVVDKSAARMRKTLASVAWDARLTQWLHCLLMDSLPSTYMASYLDILQTLKTKLPTLMDKMLFGRPLNVSQELLAPAMKKQWEPIVNQKVRKLAQNAVIVALPSMPTSGPVPNRLQKWYQQLASITQIVQVTLPMTSSHITRQPLEQIAEQIVSLTRVKIQELRNESPARSIILVGFNAGAALALQVAMSENVACVVCMGFAYNTFNGVRGTPDDRLLDIKIPILFVIGQNSARSSPEEIESLRERMQSETSLVVVGSADDALRVPKSRRKIDNVTQNMVDTMVVDEVYEFIKKMLTNPPGPRIPTAITNLIYNKAGRNSVSNTAAGEGVVGAKGTVVPRKRKQDAANTDPDQLPAKAKYAQSMGRPRTRPLAAPSSTPVKTTQIITATALGGKAQTAHRQPQQQQQKSQISSNTFTNEDLNMAIQSILSDSNETDSVLHSRETNAQKLVTNYELVAPSKSTPIKTALLNPLQKQTILSGGSGGGISAPSIGTKIKMIPSNQFVQLKPPLQSQSKIYTIKTAAMLGQSQPQQQSTTGAGIGSIVTTTLPSGVATGQPHQQQIFTLKSPNGQTTQFVTAAPATAQQKYTVVKNASGGTSLQLTAPVTTVKGTNVGASVGSSVDLSNIIDMPIIFADGDGNLSDSMSTGTDCERGQLTTGNSKPSTSSGVGQLIISQKIIKEAGNAATTSSSAVMNTTPTKAGGGGTYVINKVGGSTLLQQPSVQTSKPNKVVFINRNTMKPCPNIISRSNVAQQLPKYTKVVVTNPKTSATTLVPRPATQITTTQLSGGTAGGVAAGTSSPLVSTVKQVNLQALRSPVSVAARQSGIFNVATKSLPQIQIINASTGNVTTGTASSSAAISVAGAADKPQIRNIVVKPGGLKQIPAYLKTQLLNRNLTVRKLVNIVPATKATVTTAATATGGNITFVASSAAATAQDTGGGTSSTSTGGVGIVTATAIQTSPKIITLNPINPSVGTTVAASASAMPSVSTAGNKAD